MRRHRIFAVICILALALGAGYFLHRSAFAGRNTHTDPPVIAQPESKTESATAAQKQSQHRNVASASFAPLPPPGTPLKDIYDELAARARSGDRQASVRLFHDTEKCRDAENTRSRISFTLPTIMRATQPADSESNDISNQMLDGMQAAIDWVKQTQVLCAGLDPDKFESGVDWMRLAAEQGDREAIDCYLDLDFLRAGNVMRHSQRLIEFRQTAPALAEAAVRAGDWKATVALQLAYDGGWDTNWLGQIVVRDPVQAYRYAYLLTLGEGNDSLPGERVQVLESQLSPRDVTDAKRWAEETFANNFHGKRPYTGELRALCPNPKVWPD